jgi:hypothetical protein
MLACVARRSHRCAIVRAMPRDGSLVLSDVRAPTLTIVCEPCGRRGRYNVERLIAKHGDAKLLYPGRSDNVPATMTPAMLCK